MNDYKKFGRRERKALSDFIEGNCLNTYEDAVLLRVLSHLYASHSVISRAVIEGLAPESAATKVYEDGLKLADIIKTRGDAWATKWKQDNPKSVARARTLAARALQPKTFWQRLWS